MSGGAHVLYVEDEAAVREPTASSLREHGFRPFACLEHAGTFQREVYHPQLGFYRATGRDDHEALLGILRQIWLVDGLHEVRDPEVRPRADA